MMYFIYILECENKSYYIGYTVDIQRRYQEHCNGSVKCKYTRSFPPKRIAACWQFEGVDVGQVLRLEKSLKGLTKAHKCKLINKPQSLAKFTDMTFRSVVDDCDFAI